MEEQRMRKQPAIGKSISLVSKEDMRIPTMFLVPTRDKLMSVSYVRDLYDRLPPIKKKFVEVNGGHWWMLSHSKEAAQVICDWFDETL